MKSVIINTLTLTLKPDITYQKEEKREVIRFKSRRKT